MKAILLTLGMAALFLGGCATYQGGTGADSASIAGFGSSEGGPAYPVYTTGSPNGQDMGGTRPDIVLWR